MQHLHLCRCSSTHTAISTATARQGSTRTRHWEQEACSGVMGKPGVRRVSFTRRRTNRRDARLVNMVEEEEEEKEEEEEEEEESDDEQSQQDEAGVRIIADADDDDAAAGGEREVISKLRMSKRQSSFAKRLAKSLGNKVDTDRALGALNIILAVQLTLSRTITMFMSGPELSNAATCQRIADLLEDELEQLHCPARFNASRTRRGAGSHAADDIKAAMMQLIERSQQQGLIGHGVTPAMMDLVEGKHGRAHTQPGMQTNNVPKPDNANGAVTCSLTIHVAFNVVDHVLFCRHIQGLCRATH
jgi:hypothetical protein